MAKRPGSAHDPLWYKDAIIYELHVKAFFDGNNDGVGDLQGLLHKLDYLQDLGVTCVWLLPLFPSPLRDDGYDISDYLNIHPDYGTLQDFRAVLAAAHDRGLQVMIELVVNHTSDQHPWFVRARHAPPGSPERDFYVWSDTDQRFKDARIIFTDTEQSNWTWDPVAKAYYWHRFFSHQPDLNYDNPAVVEEVIRAMRFWLDLGVDGLRLDAIPYLIERDGTNCENLPETHEIIKRIRHEMDAGHSGRMILAEANQWPADVRPYFGDGDECHMAFHFPLMPRIFMALRLEDRMPITEIMAQTPPIPENCQWGLFLRNHDELTLEMVSEDERDYMYLAYSADPRMRINIGIRRRLAPLMDNNRRRIELLNSLLFSFPGTPIIYYGDEIGMGDNIYLGDRNGVRTPMQWSADRNAGFSRATPARLYSPLVMDPVYGYDAINVEAQHSDPSSLLHWMRNMIALRKLFKVFGRGTLEFLHPSNRKVLAYLRRYGDEQVLCVANLSRFAQPVELDLSALAGMRPVEMLGFVEFRTIGSEPYQLTLGPYGFLWFELQRPEEPVDLDTPDTFHVHGGWETLFDGAERQRLETRALPRFLAAQRWFGAKTRRITSATVADWAEIEPGRSVLALVEVNYASGDADSYLVPLSLGGRGQTDIPPAAILGHALTPRGPSVIYDGAFDDSTCRALLDAIAGAREWRTRYGVLRASATAAFVDASGAAGESLTVQRSAGEQSNTSIVFGQALILKLFRRQEPGPNPDAEISAFLTTRQQFQQVPPLLGLIEYVRGDVRMTVAQLQRLVVHEGDGWTWTLEELERYYERCATIAFPAESGLTATGLVALAGLPDSALTREQVGIYLDAAATLGRRTAEMHMALAAEDSDPAFAPVPLEGVDLAQLASELRQHAATTFERLKESLPQLPDDAVEQAGWVLGRRRHLLERFALLEAPGLRAGARIRIHGDYHLGQVLRVRQDYVVIDFEGEPARPIAERRAKHSPLKDVAGMLRSFSYAAGVGLASYTARRPDDPSRLEPWARLWERSVAASFLRAYRDRAGDAAFLPADPAAVQALLDAYLLDKALYEVTYELDNRPTWVRIPLRGILTLQG